jgi:hypothetical protein
VLVAYLENELPADDARTLLEGDVVDLALILTAALHLRVPTDRRSALAVEMGLLEKNVGPGQS